MTAKFDGGGPSDSAITEAYLYLLGRMLVVRQEHADAAEAGFAYNTIKFNPLGSAEFVNPNFDVAYLECWFAVDDDTAVLLEVPEVTGRYYTAQILDEWGEVIVNINDRATPAKPFGMFALTKPGSDPRIPDGATRIDLHSSKAKMLARVELQSDPQAAVDLQHQFRVTPLGEVAISSPPAIPAFNNRTLLGVEAFELAGAVLSTALDVSPDAAALQLLTHSVAAYVAAGKDARERVDQLLRTTVIPEFVANAIATAAPYRNHWAGGGIAGNYGADVRLRTVINYAGIWANTDAEVIYYVALRDSDEEPLSGDNSYVIRFPAEALPESIVDAYWSIILVGMPDFRVVDNPLKRYNFNTYSPLTRQADGSLSIAIGPEALPDVPESNWLPAPLGQPFSLTTRFYVPKHEYRPPRGTWAPPAVTKVKPQHGQ